MGKGLTAIDVRNAVAKLKKIDSRSNWVAISTPYIFSGTIGSYFGVNFIESTARPQWLIDFEKRIK